MLILLQDHFILKSARGMNNFGLNSVCEGLGEIFV